MEDGFVTCPHCGSQLCYAQNVDGQETWACFSCGFTSTTLMKEGSETEKAVSAKHPNLYKDLKFVDKDGYVWYPSVVTVPGKGMIYVDGSDSENWQWAVTPMRPLTKKEKRMKAYAGKEHLVDVRSTKYFGKDGYVEAMAFLGLLGENE